MSAEPPPPPDATALCLGEARARRQDAWAAYAVDCLWLVPIVYIVVRTHRERSQVWWARLKRTGVPGAAPMLWLMYLVACGSASLAMPLLVHLSRPCAEEPKPARYAVYLAIATKLAAASAYVAWPAVVFVSHGIGYGILLALLAVLLNLATLPLLAVQSLVPALVYAPHALWCLYLLYASISVWRANRAVHIARTVPVALPNEAGYRGHQRPDAHQPFASRADTPASSTVMLAPPFQPLV
jgi:hypothetical protein